MSAYGFRTNLYHVKSSFRNTQFRNFITAILRYDKDESKFTLSDLKEMFDAKKTYSLENSPVKDPLFIFQSWYRDASDCIGVLNPSVMCLATSSLKGIPSLRYMFCESFDSKGFRFFTYNTTRKGEDLKSNPYASMCFYWAPLLRTVRVEGPVDVLPATESDELFNRRDYDMQVNIHCSTQTQRIKSFRILNEREHLVRRKYDPAKVPRPENFCWYIINPIIYDFWQLRQKKERIRFRKGKPNEELDGLTHKGEKDWLYEFVEP